VRLTAARFDASVMFTPEQAVRRQVFDASVQGAPVGAEQAHEGVAGTDEA
jgi:hypothetical protein